MAGRRLAVELDGHPLTLTNLDKVLYPASGFTKGDVIAYYLAIAPVLLPHVLDRPLTLRRFPDGVDAESFYEKHKPRGTPPWVRSIHLPRTPGSRESGTVEHVVVCDAATLAWTANLAALELHVPMWRIDRRGRPDPPDLMVFDLDPGAPATIVECAEVALLLREALGSAHRWEAHPKTSGSKGMQLYVRLPDRDRPESWEANATRPQAEEIARTLAAEHRDLVVANMRKDLRAGRVLIDWSQNHVAKTTVAPYSLRARTEPTVSTPLTWDEVRRCAEGSGSYVPRFLPHEVLERVEAGGDLFAALVDDA
ncbi:MAG: non-homologous end-joining DNA ligase [Acidimicrobiales bacterium]